MPSLLKPCTAATLLLLVCLLHGSKIQAAALRQYPLRGGDLDKTQGHPPSLPSTEMVKALEYIESLQQQRDGSDYDDNGEKFRSRWWQEGVGHDGASQQEDDESRQLLKTLLTSLQGAREDHKPAALLGNKDNTRKTAEAGDYGGYPSPKNGKPHKMYPLMFEDEDSRVNPYKRTNENAEPQYTPQSLATLQSVFQDLGKLSASKNYKRHSRDQELYRGDDDDLYRLRDMAYEDVVGGGEWTPVEEKVETEEEIKDSREEFDRGLDNSEENDEEDDDDDGDADDDNDDHEEEEGNDSSEEHYIKRSSQPPKHRGKDDPDDYAKLVDYYLLKVLEKTEESEQKREEQEAEKRSVKPSYDVDPQAVYQLIKISEKLQVPPEDLIELLKNGEVKKKTKVLVPDERGNLEQVEEKLMHISTYNKDRGPITKYYTRRLPDRRTDLKILKLLGLGPRGKQRARPLYQQRKLKNAQLWYYTPSGRKVYRVWSSPSISDRKDNYGDTVDDDKLATYLAAKMLTQYPKELKKADLKYSSQSSPKDDSFGMLEQAVLDYFDHLASEKNSLSKRLPKPDSMADPSVAQGLDDETLLKMLEYLNPETSEKEDRDIYEQNIVGM